MQPNWRCWLGNAHGVGAGPSAAESAELRDVKKRNRLLKQEVEVLRRATAYFAKDVIPK